MQVVLRVILTQFILPNYVIISILKCITFLIDMGYLYLYATGSFKKVKM